MKETKERRVDKIEGFDREKTRERAERERLLYWSHYWNRRNKVGARTTW